MKRLLTICAATLMIVGCSNEPVDDSPMPETQTQEFDEAEMDAAIATARSRVDEFLKVLGENGGESFSVKAPIRDGEETEHFWIVNVSFEDGVFTGEIGNDPGLVKNVKAGQIWEIKKDEISDWMSTIGDSIHGGFTIDPLWVLFQRTRQTNCGQSLSGSHLSD